MTPADRLRKIVHQSGVDNIGAPTVADVRDIIGDELTDAEVNRFIDRARTLVTRFGHERIDAVKWTAARLIVDHVSASESGVALPQDQ